ncbi:MAG: hypothetical protein K0M40_09615 [Prolixibacteraceae bacterium]|nr:hypothetical protein [Prolixibacteraceae bacterium]
MRFILIPLFFLFVFEGYSQNTKETMLSGIVVGNDSVPVSDVAIINIRTGKTTRTNTNGFFQIEIALEDSFLVYHIAYKKRIINEKHNGRYIVLEPQIVELMQVDVTDKNEKELKNLEETVDDIKRLSPLKKPEGFDIKSRQSYFYEQHGSHTKGFSPFFGPTVRSPIGKIISLVAGSEEKRQRKKLTSHYQLVKKKVK